MPPHHNSNRPRRFALAPVQANQRRERITHVDGRNLVVHQRQPQQIPVVTLLLITNGKTISTRARRPQTLPSKSDQTETEDMVASQIRGAAIGAIFLSLLFSVPSAWYIGSTFPLVLFLVGGEYIILIIGFALLYIISSLLYLKRRLRTFGYVS